MYNNPYKIYKRYQVNNDETPFKVIPVFKKPISIVAEEAEGEFEDGLETIKERTAEEIAQEILANAKEDKDYILAEARLEAQRVLDDAMDEAEVIKQQAFEKAYEAGFKQAAAELEEQYRQLLAEAEEMKMHAIVDYNATLEGAEREIVKLALEIAKKVIGQELDTNPTCIVALVKDALKRTTDREKISIKVSEADFEVLNDHLPANLGRDSGLMDIDIRHNAGLNPGDVIVETAYGIIDGSLDKKIQQLEDAFETFLAEEEDTTHRRRES